ncbi:MAG: class I SAM-dependent methyltransferase [Deltaproteobacteria bacterium]|nr:class I SAM-dependent methyltransferase [Deltaproteobacteria bacterium]
MAVKESFREWNEAMVKKYNPEDYIFRSNFLVRFVELKRFRKIQDLLRLSNNDNFLDIGCGSGYFLNKAICKRGVGVDISDLMVKTARRNCGNNNRKLIVQSDAESLPFKNKSFDKIVSTEVIEHIQHPHALLEEMERVSKKDAAIVITIPNEKHINCIKNIIFSLRIYKLLFRKGYRPAKRMDDEWHLHIFNAKKFKELIKGKFNIKKIIPIPTGFFPLRYIFSLTKVFS